MSGYLDETGVVYLWGKTKKYVDDAVSLVKDDMGTVYRFKGSVDDLVALKALRTDTLSVGDVYNVKSNQMNYAWTGETSNDAYDDGWDSLGGTFSDASSIEVPSVAGKLIYSGHIQSPILYNYDPRYVTLSGATTGTNAGTYTMKVSLKDPSKTSWADGGVDEKTIKWSIYKQRVSEPTIRIQNYPYTGKEQSPIIDGYDPGTMTINGDGYKGTEPNSYSFTVHPKSNYAFLQDVETLPSESSGGMADGPGREIILKWTIEESGISIPTITTQDLDSLLSN